MSTSNPNNPGDIQLAYNLAADSAAVRAHGVFALYVWGTTVTSVKLQVSPDNGTTWMDYPGASFSAAGMFAPVYLGQGNLVKMVITGSGVNATLGPIP